MEQHRPKKRTRMPSWDMMELDAVLPSQWGQLHAGQVSGEWRLYHAVLSDAVDVLKLAARTTLTVKERGLLLDTRAWVASDDLSWPFSFVNVCEVLGVDPSAFRRAVRLGTLGRVRRPGVLLIPCASAPLGITKPALSPTSPRYLAPSVS